MNRFNNIPMSTSKWIDVCNEDYSNEINYLYFFIKIINLYFY